MSVDELTGWAAAYAALVATAALALEIRRWFESGPRLSLRLMPLANTYGGVGDPEADYLCAIVTNRGSQSTTLTHFALMEYRTILHRWRGRNCKAGVVLRPDLTGGVSLPHLIAPGTEWMGAALYDTELREWARSGKLFVGIHSSHRSRPIVRKVILPSEVASKTG